MPIVIDRHTGQIISKPEWSQEQINTAWEIIIKNYVRRHPEIFDDALPGKDSEEG